MNIYVYSDESGVFDKKHNDIFVFGGLIFIGNKSRDDWNRKYIHVENTIRKNNSKYNNDTELKASLITNEEKYKLFRSLNQCFKFGGVIDQNKIHDRIFNSKKDKQRYLDYAYMIIIKKYFKYLILNKILNKDEKMNIYFFVDEHTTATNGRYELKESLEQELKRGTYNHDYSKAFPPVFNNLMELNLFYCDSASKTLIRAADIIANNIFYKAKINDNSIYTQNTNMHIIQLP